MRTAERATRPAAVLIAAVVAVLVAFGTMLLVLQLGSADRTPAEPVVVGAEAPGGAAQQLCPGLMALLPQELDGAPRRAVDSPSEYVAAWGDPAVTLRCGAPEPVDLTPTSALLTVNGVAWFQQEGVGGVRWTAVGREVYVDVTVPQESAAQEAVLVPMSRIVAASVPAVAAEPTG